MKVGSKSFVIALSALVIALAAPWPDTARAKVSDDDVCWEPDIEFPVPCDNDEDD